MIRNKPHKTSLSLVCKEMITFYVCIQYVHEALFSIDRSLREAVLSKLWEHVPEWETASNKLRLATVLFFLFMAALSIILSFFPVSYAAVQVYPEYQHVTTPPV